MSYKKIKLEDLKNGFKYKRPSDKTIVTMHVDNGELVLHELFEFESCDGCPLYDVAHFSELETFEEELDILTKYLKNKMKKLRIAFKDE